MKTTFYPFLTVLFFVFLNINISTAQETNAKIQEVYGDKTQEMVGNDPERQRFLIDLLENRIEILKSENTSGDKYIKLSTAALLNKYNPDLKRDAAFDPLNFNPLKYNLIFTSKKTEIYRVDNTDYIIVINPQTISK